MSNYCFQIERHKTFCRALVFVMDGDTGALSVEDIFEVQGDLDQVRYLVRMVRDRHGVIPVKVDAGTTKARAFGPHHFAIYVSTHTMLKVAKAHATDIEKEAAEFQLAQEERNKLEVLFPEEKQLVYTVSGPAHVTVKIYSNLQAAKRYFQRNAAARAKQFSCQYHVEFNFIDSLRLWEVHERRRPSSRRHRCDGVYASSFEKVGTIAVFQVEEE